MRSFMVILAVACVGVGGGMVAADESLKVFISIDMEGVTGVANWEDVSRDGKDYELFRKIMTLEANAAVEGAAAAGATEIWVRDSHGSARNILPELLDRRAVLVRDWSGGPKSMMEGIGAAAVSLHPEATRERIRAGVEKALNRLDDFEPYRLEAPYTLVVKLKSEETVNQGSPYPGVVRTGEWELTYSSDDFLEIMLAFSYVRR